MVKSAVPLDPTPLELLAKSEIARGIEEKRDWKDLLVKITSLRKEFVEANDVLLPYELRQCELVSLDL